MRYSDLFHGGEWKDHKYVAKIKLANGKYRYFYSLKEFQNYVAIEEGKKLEDRWYNMTQPYDEKTGERTYSIKGKLKADTEAGLWFIDRYGRMKLAEAIENGRK